jgi:hypothetical protein
MATDWHLAQYNVARALAPPDSATMADFYAQVAEVNALAEASPGFVWRPVSGSEAEQGFNDPLLLLNLSVWESIDALRAFTYRSRHLEVFRRRHLWFTPPGGPSHVLWWIPAGQRPAFVEGAERLQRLAQSGPAPEAFTFASPFPPAAA